ncbi:MAG: His/Gly/Thr/Pro-type tRNA ligase C-terminal domain-containing protein, partial [Candidatus Bathyarchaeota archaeon]|nr:His/Gly/Thr/Pro-type tRNA ligase C-terminal domain-containing protein [Candidatus Bathyarchaeota archaeon]
YTGMIFEAFIPEIDVALGGGGRYDKLIELFGGQPIPAVGVAQGIDRIVLSMNKQKVGADTSKLNSAVVISVKDESMGKALELADTLRKAGVFVELAVMGRSMGKALADADRRGVCYAVIVGPKELAQQKVVVKDMKAGEQKTVDIQNLTQEVLGHPK